MTALRQRYIADLRLRNKSPRTIETYVLRVSLFARHFGRSPERLGPEHVRAYHEHLIARPVSWSTFNQAAYALRFLYQVTLGRPTHRSSSVCQKTADAPTVLSPGKWEFPGLTLPGRTALWTASPAGGEGATGLRVSDRQRSPGPAPCGSKGQKDRLVLVAALLLVRVYWRVSTGDLAPYCGGNLTNRFLKGRHRWVRRCLNASFPSVCTFPKSAVFGASREI